jgi:hypothetical protein
LQSPHLMNASLWKEYYSKDLLFGVKAREHWCIPDIQPLPSYMDVPRNIQPQSRTEDPLRLVRFGFGVVKKYMTSGVHRGYLVKEALNSLQTVTIRQRATDPAIPPYSETQAYCWIQLAHAALSTVYGPSAKERDQQQVFHVPLSRLSFETFRVLFHLDQDSWKRFYSVKLWNSIEARMSFVNPDLKPLPNIINTPTSSDVRKAMEAQLNQLGVVNSLPSVEELILLSEMLVKLSKEIPIPVSSKVTSHAHLIVYLFTMLSVSDKKEAPTLARRATSAMLELEGSQVASMTLKIFWTQQVLRSVTRLSDEKQSFMDFIRSNMHLAYEDLPMTYYSPERLKSLDAEVAFVAPDLRPLDGFVPARTADPLDDLYGKGSLT